MTVTSEQIKRHEEIMLDLQTEWVENHEIYSKTNERWYGIRSSQISALIMYLIRKGVIK